MEEKKVKIEVSRFALVFIILFALSLLIWSFVIGVWIGTKMESNRKEVTLEEPGVSYKEEAHLPSASAPTSAPGPTPTPTTPAPSEANKTTPTPSSEVKNIPPVTPEKPTSEKPKVREEKKIIRYQDKEVAKIASQIKKPTSPSYYSIQIGAFSQKEIAESLKNKAKSEGFETFIKESKENGKVLYKVYIGKYSTKEEAKKYLSNIEKSLNIKEPFVVEIK